MNRRASPNPLTHFATWGRRKIPPPSGVFHVKTQKSRKQDCLRP